MKVVLLKDIAGVGRKYEVKNVADGYAVNFLIPQKMAEAGTAPAVKRAEQFKKAADDEKKIQANLLEKNFLSLDGAAIALTEKANEKGHLFSGIHKEAIVAELKKQKGIDLLQEFIDLPHPIKEIGEHRVPIAVSGKKSLITVIVTPSE